MSMATDVVDAQIEAYRAKDVERFLSHYADDASGVLFDGTPMFADKQAMREQYGKLFADSPDLHLTVASRMTAGDFVIDEEHVSGMHFADMPAEMTALSAYQVTNDHQSDAPVLTSTGQPGNTERQPWRLRAGLDRRLCALRRLAKPVA